jgi:hypothetical protein
MFRIPAARAINFGKYLLHHRWLTDPADLGASK